MTVPPSGIPAPRRPTASDGAAHPKPVDLAPSATRSSSDPDRTPAEPRPFPAGDCALDVRGLGKTFPGFALRGVDLQVPTGHITGFVGPNGAGKTTTIKCALGMIRPDAGRIEVLGRRVDPAVALPQDVGVVLDTPYYVGEWRLDRLGRILARQYSRWDPAAFAEACTRFGLDPRRRVAELSRGQGVKLMIAVALSHRARLLVLDEPTSGLDPVARQDLLDVLGEFLTDEDHSVLFSTHITADLERIADHAVVIRDGRIVAAGTLEDLAARWVMVRGGVEELPADRSGLLGLRTWPTGFEAMVEAADARAMAPDLIREPPSLEEIVVHVAKGAAA